MHNVKGNGINGYKLLTNFMLVGKVFKDNVLEINVVGEFYCSLVLSKLRLRAKRYTRDMMLKVGEFKKKPDLRGF